MTVKNEFVLLVDCIVEHSSDINRTPHSIGMREFLLVHRVRNGLGPLPADDAPVGKPLVAYISIGRWVVDCDICGSAVVADSGFPWFCCTACGSRGEWRPVKFPMNKTAIEAVLLKRPGFRNAAPNRNWRPQDKETFATLWRENRDHGLEA